MEALQNAPVQRPAGRAERIGRAVVQATIELLNTGGSSAVTFDKVAEHAGVNRTTLYRRWGNKSRLLTWVMLEFMAEQAPTPDTGSLDGDLLEIMLNLDEVLGSSAGHGFFQVIAIAAREDETVDEAVRSFWRQRFELAQPVYERAIQRGELTTSLDYELLIDLVFGPFFYRVLRTGKAVSRKEAKTIIGAVLKGLRRGG